MPLNLHAVRPAVDERCADSLRRQQVRIERAGRVRRIGRARVRAAHTGTGFEHRVDRLPHGDGWPVNAQETARAGRENRLDRFRLFGLARPGGRGHSPDLGGSREHGKRDLVRRAPVSRLRFGGCAVRLPLFEKRPVHVPDVRPDAQLPPLACFGILAARSRRGGLFGQQRVRCRLKLGLGRRQLAVQCRQPGILFGGSRLGGAERVELAAKGGLLFLNCDVVFLSLGHSSHRNPKYWIIQSIILDTP